MSYVASGMQERTVTTQIEGLRKAVPLALQSVKMSTIFGSYKSCMRKMELYRRGVGYGTVEWKNLTSHQKVYIHGEDR